MNKWHVIGLCLLLALVITGCTIAKTETNDQKSSFKRLVFVEHYNTTGVDIFYDQLTNVMYMASYKGGIAPIYNADGSLYLHGTPKTVG